MFILLVVDDVAGDEFSCCWSVFMLLMIDDVVFKMSQDNLTHHHLS